MTDDPVLGLAAVIEEKERATEGLDMVAAAKIEAELATLYNPFAKPPAVLGRLKAVERILE